MRALVAWTTVACACGGGGGESVDAPPLADARPDAQQKMFGLVAIIENKAMNTTAEIANFGVDPSVIIASRDEGPCHIEQANRMPALPTNAGTITISGGAGGPVTMPYVPGEFYIATATGFSFAANDQLTVSATGATVPAFSGQIAFPSLVTVTSGSPTLVRKSGFTATWDPTTSAVTLEILQSPSGAPTLNVSCSFDGAAGTGTIPAVALSDLLTTVTANVTISTQSNVMMMAGVYPADLLAIYGALQRDNLPVQP